MVTFPYLNVPNLEIEYVEQNQADLLVTVSSMTTSCRCPACGSLSSSVHSTYQRQLQDLPVSEWAVVLRLKLKRFRCQNPNCGKQTFVEALPELFLPRAQRSRRLTTVLWHIGQIAGGQSGARLAQRLHMPASRCTLLRILRRQSLPERAPPQVVGVDDWAKRKGQAYGTVVVDLERHAVLDLLPDREAGTLAAWLKDHPTVRVVARDRSLQFAQGITDGAPVAMQVADRWHLLKNRSEMLERALREVFPQVKKQLRASVSTSAPRPTFPRSQRDEEKQRDVRAQRLHDYTVIQFLRQKGYSERRIARLLGMSRGKVRLYAAAASFPERKSRYVPSRLDPFLPYLEQRFQAGCTNARQLWRELRARGYVGGSGQVSKWMRQRRQAIPAPQPSSEVLRFVALPDLPTCLRLFVARPERLTPSEQWLLQRILQVAPLQHLYDLSQRFSAVVCQGQVMELDAWLKDCSEIPLNTLKLFAASLQQDYDAVRNALEQPWSNGQTEGQVNRLKLLKRQMYGRAKLDLLRLRVLYSSSVHIT